MSGVVAGYRRGVQILRRSLPVLACLLTLTACQFSKDKSTPPASMRPPARAIVTAAECQALLDAQREAWDRGDFEAFMAGYWNSPELGFVGSSGLRQGYAATLKGYRDGYPDAESRGKLTFELVRVRPLDSAPHCAVVVGRWFLERGAPIDGWFSLVVERRPEGLRIVHDHSSASD